MIDLYKPFYHNEIIAISDASLGKNYLNNSLLESLKPLVYLTDGKVVGFCILIFEKSNTEDQSYFKRIVFRYVY